MSTLDEVGERDGWRCWLCDEPVDPDRSVNDDRGPSVDSITTRAKAKAKSKSKSSAKAKTAGAEERLAHRACNTGRGATAPVVPWLDTLFVIDPAPILASSERLERKGGREVMARCPTEEDAQEAAAWLVDRLSRLQPNLEVTSEIDAGGGQYLLVLRA